MSKPATKNRPAVAASPRNQPVVAAPPTRRRSHLLILVFIYLFAVGVHVVTLWEPARFPHLSTDEAQYTMVGENLRLGNGYTIRGQIHSAMPPVYPLFVAAAHTLGGPSRHSVLCFNCVAICLVVFPAFCIAQRFHLSLLNSYLMALAAVFLPHTFYAAMYMAESLQYPLVLTAFYLSIQWLDHPFFSLDVWLGILLGVGLLNKLAEMSFLIGLLSTVLVLSRRNREEIRPRRARHALIVFGIVIALELAWITWKRAHGVGALGTYGTALAESAHASASVKLLLAYLGDFFLAPGLIVAVPLFYWFRDNWRKQRSLAVLLAATLLCQLGIHGFFEARLTGLVRERLFLYSFPLIAIAAVAGMERFKHSQRGNIWLRLVACYASLVFVALVSLYNYPAPSPAVEAPWANLLGSFTLNGFEDFKNHTLLLDSFGAVLIAATLLLALPRRKSAAVLAAFVVLFQVSAFLFAARALTVWSRIGVASLQPIVNWLASSGVEPGQPLFIAGGPWAFEGPGGVTSLDEFFQRWAQTEGPYGMLSVQLEALARYDVRMISGAAQIPTRMKPGDFLMIDTRVSGLDLVAEMYPYYLYRQPFHSTDRPRALYTIDLPATAFSTIVGKVLPDRAIAGTGDGRTGVLAISNGMFFVPGRYRLSPHIRVEAGSQVVLAMNMQATNRVLAQFDLPAPGPLVTEVVSGEPLNFSVYGKSASDFLFEGLTVQFVSALPVPAFVMPKPTQQFLPQASGVSINQMAVELSCSVDNLNNAGIAPANPIRKAEGLHLFGWAFNSRTHLTDGALLVEIVSDDNRAYYAKAERNDRLDVAAAFHAPDLAHSGFLLHAGLTAVPAGWYRVYLVQMEHGKPVECSNYRNIVVEEDTPVNATP